MLLLGLQVAALPPSDRITLPSGEKIFVSGYNLAWKNFANDAGSAPLDTAYFSAALRAVRDSGGNTMRIWLSTNATHDPRFSPLGDVAGPGPYTIGNIQTMFELAQKHKMLLMPVLMTHNYLETRPGTNIRLNRRLLETDAGLDAYIRNSLVPMVKAVGLHPNLLCWEIFNEPEGMVEEVGWTTYRTTMWHIRRVTNRVASAIHRTVPGVLVSTGTLELRFLSPAAENINSDRGLRIAGGMPDGTLDFYMAHYYPWNGPTASPFLNRYADLALDKPLVIGEFPTASWGPGSAWTPRFVDSAVADTLFQSIHANGYAGALAWQYQPDRGVPWLTGFRTSSMSMANLAREIPGKLDPKLPDLETRSFTKVFVRGNGRILFQRGGILPPGEQDTLHAVADSGHEFVRWIGAGTDSLKNPLPVRVEAGKVVTAEFRPADGNDILRDGSFLDGLLKWDTWVDTTKGSRGSYWSSGGQAVLDLKTADTSSWNVWLWQDSLPLQVGRQYVAWFTASAKPPRPIRVLVRHNGRFDGDWGKVQASTVMNLDSIPTRYSFRFRSSVADSQAMLVFEMGKHASRVRIGPIALGPNIPPPPIVPPPPTVPVRLEPPPDLPRLWKFADEIRWSRENAGEPLVLVVMDIKGKVFRRQNLPSNRHDGAIRGLPGGVNIIQIRTPSGNVQGTFLLP